MEPKWLQYFPGGCSFITGATLPERIIMWMWKKIQLLIKDHLAAVETAQLKDWHYFFFQQTENIVPLAYFTLVFSGRLLQDEIVNILKGEKEQEWVIRPRNICYCPPSKAGGRWLWLHKLLNNLEQGFTMLLSLGPPNLWRDGPKTAYTVYTYIYTPTSDNPKAS